MRRWLPCWSCGRPTPAAELVETHVYAGQTAGCARLAAPLRKPAHRFPRERR